MELFALVEGQTLLHGGRFRFLRRIGSGTFAVILRALDVQLGHAVAIKCMQRQEYNAIGEQEAVVLRQISASDPDAHCAVVRLLDTFVEHELFCLVLEILGDAVLNVSLWGPWRQPYQEHSLHSPSSARRHKLHSVVGTTRAPAPNSTSSSSSTVAAVGRAASPLPVCYPSVSPLSLDDVRQIAVHLCGALAFLHAQGLIHADLKPENIVRSSPVPLSSLTAPVKLIDFGNYIEYHKIPLYQARGSKKPNGSTTTSDAGFDVQTLAYRAPEVAAGIEISSAIDMWSLGCVLLECVSGEPLFTTSPAVFGIDAVTGHETENEVILRQIELLVNGGKPLSAVHEAYQEAECYSGSARVLNRSNNREHVTGFPTLSERLAAMAAVSESASHAHFHDFIKRLLDADPNTRLTARGALIHPFVQAFFPFKLVFLNAEPVRPAVVAVKTRNPITITAQVKKASCALPQSIKQKKRESGQPQEVKSQALMKKKKVKRQRFASLPLAAAASSAQSSSLRAALKLIPTMKRET